MLDLDHLNKQQLKAVKSNDKPLLLLAGAGSGKTRVITYKIAYLIDSGKFRPENILALTFTKKAANEMTERIRGLVSSSGYDITGMYVGTFHAFGAYVLRKYGSYVGLDKNFSIYDGEDQLSLVKNIIKEGTINTTVKPKAVLSKITWAKLQGIEPEDYFKNSYGDFFDEIVSKVYKEYAKRLKSLNAVDFTDLLRLVIKLFNNSPHVLESLRQRYKYILVDEYQDTNNLQYEIVYRLASKHRNICVVGDEDQSIYSWRGATIENISRFTRDFPEHELIKLERNYRSTQIILEAANSVIARNPNRIEKKLWTDLKHGEPIKIVGASNPEAEAMFIVRELEKYRDNLNEVAILYRVNAISRVFEEVFVRFGVPYRLVGGVGFYQRMEIKDLLAYLKFINNPKDEVSLLRIINTPSRKIGAKAIEKFREYAKSAKLSLSDFIWYVSMVAYDPQGSLAFMSKEFVDYLSDLTQDKFLAKHINTFSKFGELLFASFDYSVDELLEMVLNKLAYKSWIDKLSSSKEELESRRANIKELISVAKRNVYRGREGLHSFLEDVALMEEAYADKEGEEAQRVNLMTVHAAKGLEFNTVFIVGAEEGLFPHSRSMDDPMQMQEERRLFYVAITRAKRNLYITYSQVRNGMVGMPSNYLEDIPPNLVEWEEI